MAVRSAHELRWPDLVWSHFSRPRFGDFEGRVAGAAAAGFSGIGLFVEEYRRLRDEEGRSPQDLASLLDAHGIVLAELEVMRGWWADAGPERDRAAELERLAFELADHLHVRYLQAIGPYSCSFDQAVRGFRRLCDAAAEHGLLVGIEWLPYTNIATAADAQALVRACDRPNAGYCVDIWHHVRGANDLELVRRLEPERIFAVQMSDGPPQPVHPDYKEDCLSTRVPPGDGAFDCVGFVRLLASMGVRAPISLEVASRELWAMPADLAARASADGMRRVLGLASTGGAPGAGS